MVRLSIGAALSSSAKTFMEYEADIGESRSRTKPCGGEKSKSIMQSLTTPSYTLAHGVSDIRQEARDRLCYLLPELMKRHNWDEASEVLILLLKATSNDRSPEINRLKFLATLEILIHLQNGHVSHDQIKNVFDTWLNKIKSKQNNPRLNVLCEAMLFSLREKHFDLAEQYATCLRQEPNSDSDPKSNLALGLYFYEMWYSKLKRKMQQRTLDEFYMPMESDISGANSYQTPENLRMDDAASVLETYSQLHSHSETSVMNNKNVVKREDRKQRTGSHPHVQSFYQNSLGQESGSLDGVCLPYPPIDAQRLKTSLLHILFPNPTEDMKNIVASDIDGDYNIAVEHLQHALNSIPQISEGALRPLMQLLLLGDQVDPFLKVLEMLCHTSCSTLPLRLKAHILECFDPNRSDEISTLYEVTLKKDPTSRHSVARLVDLYQAGDYNIERLLDMMSLHLDAAGARFGFWREFASCLLKLCECEEDAMSVCVDSVGAQHEQINSISHRSTPAIFVEDPSGRHWKQRCKCWLYKHFRKQILESDIASGDLQKMAHKAVTASYFYGSECKYVKQVLAVLEKQEDRSMVEYARMHVKYFVGFFPDLVKRS